jgi:hypothetical protein
MKYTKRLSAVQEVTTRSSGIIIVAWGFNKKKLDPTGKHTTTLGSIGSDYGKFGCTSRGSLSAHMKKIVMCIWGKYTQWL